MKLTMIGNYYINKIPEFSNPEIETSIKITGISPFSLGSSGKLNKYFDAVTDLSTKVDISKCLSSVLSLEENEYFRKLPKAGGRSYEQSNVSEYIVIDNTACIYALMKIPNAGIYTCEKRNAFTEAEFFSLSKDEQEKRRIVPYCADDFNWKHFFDLFIDVILERFASDKIILLKGTCNNWYYENGELMEY